MSDDDISFLFACGALALPVRDSSSGSVERQRQRIPLSIPLDAIDGLLRLLDERSVLVPLSDIVDELDGYCEESVILKTALDAGIRCMRRNGHFVTTSADNAQMWQILDTWLEE